MIRKIKSKDKQNFISYCLMHKNSDFYVVKDKQRMFIDNIKTINYVWNNILKKGDKAYIYEDNSIIKGIFVITGFADKSFRKYLKVLCDNNKIVDKMFKVLVWDYKKELFLRIKRYNEIGKVAKKYKFLFYAGRGKEILLRRLLKDNGVK